MDSGSGVGGVGGMVVGTLSAQARRACVAGAMSYDGQGVSVAGLGETRAWGVVGMGINT
jgi:hypothetical protein